MREWITTACRNTPSTTNPEDEEIVDAAGNDGNASMPEQFKRPNLWTKIIMMLMIMTMLYGKWQMKVVRRIKAALHAASVYEICDRSKRCAICRSNDLA